MTLSFLIWTLIAFGMASGLIAGVFLAFSDFVMPSLFASAPAAGTQAMQVINRKVYRSLFMVLLVGMIPLSLVGGLLGYLIMEGPVAALLIVAGGLYFFGVFVASAIGNVPLNERMGVLTDGGLAAQLYWPEYVRGWVLWNHLRWITALGTMGCYIIAAVLIAKGG